MAVMARGDARMVALSGEADLTTVPELAAALAAQVDAGARHLTVDLSALAFVDSASIGALITASHALRARGGTLELAGPQPIVARTLGLLGVDEVIPIRGGAVARSESDPAGYCRAPQRDPVSCQKAGKVNTAVTQRPPGPDPMVTWSAAAWTSHSP